MQSNAAPCPSLFRIPSPSQIKQRLDNAVIGNDDAKMYLASVVFKHLSLSSSDLGAGSKSHTLIVGPTGVGKSYLVNALREILDVPLVTIDATTLTEAGYQGRDVDGIFEDLLRASGNERAKAEKGVVFVDEFDKIKASAGGERDIRGQGVQYSLLKILDGDVRQVRSTRTSRLQSGPSGDVYMFDTSRLLFIFAGAFSSYPDLLERDFVNQGDITKLGFLEELTARIPNIIKLTKLDALDLASALDQPDYGVMNEYAILFRAMHCAVEFTSAAKRRISEEVIGTAMGYRGLRAILDRLLLPRLHSLEGRERAGEEGRFLVDYRDRNFLIERRFCDVSVEQLSSVIVECEALQQNGAGDS